MSTTADLAMHDPPPQDREELLMSVGELKPRIYAMVRTILDDLEAVAPWNGLYYPPTDPAEFLGMETALVAMIRDIPERVGSLTRALQEGAERDEASRELVDNADFYFHGIAVSVAPELEKLEAKLEALKSGSSTLSVEERNFTCELSADLKGKYTSSIMGAAASLIAEGLWHGVEIEPILFPEKAEEFDRNEKLVQRLSKVMETIHSFLDRVPLGELVASWQQQNRIDQYALAPLYSLLGDLGRLMQVSSRRALYSGDYHQIQSREVLLSERIRQLTSLHSTTWGTAAEGAGDDASVTYPAMVGKAMELAAILDVEILKKIIGGGSVKDLLFIVTMEKEDEAAGRSGGEQRKLSRRNRISEQLHPLIPLLYDEDLKTFLELLLGSVLKRASLTVQRQSPEPAVAPPAPPGVAPVTPSPIPSPGELGIPELEPPELLAPQTTAGGPLIGDATLQPAPVEPGGFGAAAAPDAGEVVEPATAPADFAPPASALQPADPNAGRLEALEKLLDVLQPLLSRASSNRKSFELVRRLLKQKRAIPAGLLQSMRPYLYDVMNQLIPQLRDEPRLGETYADYGASLFEHCGVLCDPQLSPESVTVDVPAVMEQVLDLLNRLAISARSSVEKLSESAPVG